MTYGPDAHNENPRILNYENDPKEPLYDAVSNRRVRWRIQLDKNIGEKNGGDAPYYHPINNAVDPNLVDTTGSITTNPNYNPHGRTTGAIGSVYSKIKHSIDVAPGPSHIITMDGNNAYIQPGLTLIGFDSSTPANTHCQAIEPGSITPGNLSGDQANVHESFNIKVVSRSVDASGDLVIELNKEVTVTIAGGDTIRLMFGVAQHQLKCYEFPFAWDVPYTVDGTWDGEFWTGGTPNFSTIGNPEVVGTTALTANAACLQTGRQYWDSGFRNYTSNDKRKRQSVTAPSLTNPCDEAGHSGLNEWGLNYQTIEILTTFDDTGNDSDLPMSPNPAIWETEPREDIGLDIYYEASQAFPIYLNEKNNENYINVEDVFYDLGGSGFNSGTDIVTKVEDNIITLDNAATAAGTAGTTVFFSKSIPGGLLTWAAATLKTAVTSGDTTMELERDVHTHIAPSTFHNIKTIPYYNCYSFGNGVESNRLRDDYNAVTIDKGVKASMPLATPYEEERRKSGLIFSGIYNSTSGINETNQFIQAEPITKDLNPEYGEIKKIFSRDTDLIAFCEDRVFKILANKDALFGADGNTNITATNRVLGQTIPFTGVWGMSHRESFASESYRIYFADVNRGAIIRLSRDGMTPISDHGMKDYFFDNLKEYTKLVGSFDDRKGTYNISLQQSWTQPDTTISFTDDTRGWVSFKSFIPERGCGFNNTYYTFLGGDIWEHHDETSTTGVLASNTSSANTLVLIAPLSTVVVGMNVSGYGINNDVTVIAVDHTTNTYTISQTAGFVPSGTQILFSAPRNNFYGTQYDSSINILFNGGPEVVKAFSTLKYEGSQSRIESQGPELNSDADPNTNFSTILGTSQDGEYYNNWGRLGWYVNSIKTDMQLGESMEFKEKEGLWFNKIIGKVRKFPHNTVMSAGESPFALSGGLNDIDTSEFSLQGIDKSDEVEDEGEWNETYGLKIGITDKDDNFFSNSTIRPDARINIYTENSPLETYGNTTQEYESDSVGAGTIDQYRYFIINPDTGFYISAADFDVIGGEQDVVGVGLPWTPVTPADWTWTSGNSEIIDEITFTNTTSAYTAGNKVRVKVKIESGWEMPNNSFETRIQINGIAYINPPTVDINVVIIEG